MHYLSEIFHRGRDACAGLFSFAFFNDVEIAKYVPIVTILYFLILGYNAIRKNYREREYHEMRMKTRKNDKEYK